jgi:hypothetical protein
MLQRAGDRADRLELKAHRHSCETEHEQHSPAFSHARTSRASDLPRADLYRTFEPSYGPDPTRFASACVVGAIESIVPSWLPYEYDHAHTNAARILQTVDAALPGKTAKRSRCANGRNRLDAGT